MTFIEKCRLKNELNRAIYAIRQSQSPFQNGNMAKIYSAWATDILKSIKGSV